MKRPKISPWLGVLAPSFLSIHPLWTFVIVRPTVDLRHEQTLGFFFIWHDFSGVATHAYPDFGRLIMELFPVGSSNNDPHPHHGGNLNCYFSQSPPAHSCEDFTLSLNE